MSKKKEIKRYTLSGILSWVFGVFFGMAALGAFISSSFIAGLVLLIMAAVLLPPVNNVFKEKMSFKLSKGIKIAVIIVGFVIAGMTMETETGVPTPSQNEQQPAEPQVQPEEPQAPEEKVYSMGEEIPVDYLTYEIPKAETFTEMGASVYSKETTGKFVKVYLEITNNAKETKQIFTPRFRIEDSQGRMYDRLSDDMLYISDSLEFGKQLQPGLTASGSIVFELPKDSAGLSLVISGDWVSTSQVKVSLSEITDIGKDTSQQDEQDRMMEEAMADAQRQMEQYS